MDLYTSEASKLLLLLRRYSSTSLLEILVQRMPNSFECFWALKALDNTEMSSDGIPVEQMVEISARLIEDEDIRTIVCGSMMTDTPEKDVLYGRPYDQRRNKAGKKRRTRA